MSNGDTDRLLSGPILIAPSIGTYNLVPKNDTGSVMPPKTTMRGILSKYSRMSLSFSSRWKLLLSVTLLIINRPGFFSFIADM